jgi:hypothetical protein
MTERPDFKELVGGDLGPDERADLERVDSLLRAAGPPPAEIPSSLTRRVERIGARPIWTWRRTGLALALAASLAALFFGIGRWTNGNSPHYRFAVPLKATTSAPKASGVIKVGDRDPNTGNWKLQLNVAGLPKLSGGDYYVLWLAKNGQYAGTCGTFNVGNGRTTVDMTVSYRLKDYDAWVVSRHEDSAPWLLLARLS